MRLPESPFVRGLVTAAAAGFVLAAAGCAATPDDQARRAKEDRQNQQGF